MYRLSRNSSATTPTHATGRLSLVRLLLFIVAPRFHVDQLEKGSLPIRLDSHDVLFLLRPRFEHQPALLRLVIVALQLVRRSALVLATCLRRWLRAIQNGPVSPQCFLVELRNLLRRVIRLHLHHRQPEAKRAAPDAHLNGPGVVLLVFVWFCPRINGQPHFLGGRLLAHHHSGSALILLPFHTTRSSGSRWHPGHHANHTAKHAKKCKLPQGTGSAARVNRVPIPPALFAHKTSLVLGDTRFSLPKFLLVAACHDLGNFFGIAVVLHKRRGVSSCCQLHSSSHGRFSGKHMIALGLLVATALAAAPVAPQAEKSQDAQMTLKVGDTAPEFTLLSDQWKTVKLSDYRGKKNVFLAVYVLAFTGG